MKKSAFTLIELLVVIAIIAILAGIALPVFQKAMEKSRAVQDLSNLKQMGTATVAWWGDNDDKMYGLPASGGATAVTWPNSLNPKYVPIWKAFQSPFDKRASTEKPPAPISYGVNTNLINIAGATSGYTGSASQLSSPSALILLAPALDSSTTPGNPVFRGISTQNVTLTVPTGGTVGKGKGVYDNGNKMTVVFADAHVDTLSWVNFSDSTSTDGLARWKP